MGSIKTIVRRAWGALGPGLTTGAADDDPSGIATYSQAGAQLLREAFHPSAARRWPWFCT